MEYGMEIAFYAETLLDKYIMLKLFYNGMLLNNASAKQTFWKLYTTCMTS